MARNNAPVFIAGATIAPSQFVTQVVSATANNTCVPSTTGDTPAGISQNNMYLAPGTFGANTAVAALTGQEVEVYSLGDVCLLRAGAGGFEAGQFLMPDLFGNGIPATAGLPVGARATQNTPAGQLGLVQIVPGTAVGAGSSSSGS